MSSSLCTIPREIIIRRKKAMGTLFSSKLSARITAEGLDVLEFARKAKIPSPTVYHWIAGGGVRPKNVVKVAKFLTKTRTYG